MHKHVAADVDYVLKSGFWHMKSMLSRRVYSACCMASGTDRMIRQGTGVGYNMNWSNCDSWQSYVMIIMYNLRSLMLYILALYLGLIVWRKAFMDVTRTMMQPTVLMQVTIVCAVIYWFMLPLCSYIWCLSYVSNSYTNEKKMMSIQCYQTSSHEMVVSLRGRATIQFEMSFIYSLFQRW